MGRADSERVFRAVLPLLNRYGGSARGVNAAITRLEQAGDPERFLGTLAERQATISKLDKESRLAFEMALHEQAERNAMSGELSALEDAWREAEDLARVADTLGLPSWLSNAYRRR